MDNRYTLTRCFSTIRLSAVKPPSVTAQIGRIGLVLCLLLGGILPGQAQVFYILSDGTNASGNDQLRKVNFDGSGDSPVATGFSNSVGSMVIDKAGNRAFVSNGLATGAKILAINLSTGVTTTFLNSASLVQGMAVDATNGYLYYAYSDNTIATTDQLRRVGLDGSGDTQIATGFASAIGAVALDLANNRAFVGDRRSGAPQIYAVNLSTGAFSPFVTPSTSFLTRGLVVDPVNNYLYYALNDNSTATNDQLRRIGLNGLNDIQVSTGLVVSIGEIALDLPNNRLYVADASTSSPNIESINLANNTSTVLITPASGSSVTGLGVLPVCSTFVTALTPSPSSTLTCAQTSLTLTATGGSSYVFARSGGGGILSQSTSGSALINASGTYSVTVTDVNGCTATSTTIISSNTTPPTLTASTTSLACSGQSITLTASGGDEYAFTGPGGGASIVSVYENIAVVSGTGTYSVTVTTAGCTPSTATITIGGSPASSPVSARLLGLTNIPCTNGTAGSFSITASGGAAPYTYSIPGQSNTTGVFTGLSSALYTVMIQDNSSSCPLFKRVQVVAPSNAGAYTPTILTQTYSYMTDGTPIFTPNGTKMVGNPAADQGQQGVRLALPFAFRFDNMNYSSMLVSEDGLVSFDTQGNKFGVAINSDQTYNNNAASGGGFADTTFFTPRPVIGVFWEDIASNQTVFAPPSFTVHCTYNVTGTAPNRVFSIEWAHMRNPRVGNTQANNTITMTLRLYEGSNRIETQYYREPGRLISFASYNGYSIGLGGRSLSQFLAYDRGTTDEAATTLGTFSNSVAYDANYTRPYSNTTTGTGTVFRFDPPASSASCAYFSYSVVGQTPTCTNTGSLTVDTNDGIAPYTYKVGSTTNTTGVFTGLTSGVKSVTIVDSQGSFGVVTVTIGTETPPTATLTPSPSGTLTCAQTSLTLTATGGSSYVFARTGGGGVVSQSASGSAVINAPGTYSVTVTDVNGCTATSTTTISQNTTPPSASITIPANLTVLDCNTTVLSLSASGGETYLWDNGQTTANRNVNTANTYSVTVTGANGCTAIDTQTISQNTTPPSVSLTATDICVGQSLTLTATSGIGNYTFVGGSGLIGSGFQISTTTVSGLLAGPQSFTVLVRSNVNSCTNTATATATVTAPPSLTITPNPSLTLTTGQNVTLTASGATSYSWSSGASTSVISVSVTGTYSVTGTTNGCSSVTSVTVTGGVLSMGNRVYFDQDGDGIQDTGEPGIPGTQLLLQYDANTDGIYGNANDQTFTTTTGVDGIWTVGNLPAGPYRITATPPTGQGWVNTDTFDNGLFSPSNPVTPNLTVSRADVDFGFRSTGLVGSRVWADTDGDGVQDAAEPGIPNVQLTLRYDANANNAFTDADDGIFTVLTGATGVYSVTYLPPGKYQVVVTPTTLPDNAITTYDLDGTSTPNSATAALTLGQSLTTLNFGYNGNGTIGGRVWFDANRNGVDNSGEAGISGISVTLTFGGDDGNLGTASDNLSYTTTTNVGGTYSFTGLFGGDLVGSNPNYRVSVTPSASFSIQTYDATAPTTDNQSSLSLVNNGSNLVQSFGYAPTCTTLVYVTEAGAGLQTGSSWTNAFSGTALQSAIDAVSACGGGQVWIAAGLYKPTTYTGTGSRDVFFQMRNTVAIYGGFAGTETTLTGPTGRTLSQPSSTTFSGNIDIDNTNTNNSYHVVVGTSLNSTARLDGVVITGGNADNNLSFANLGGGIFLNQSTPVLANCTLESNTAAYGGGICTYISSPSMINCVLQNNRATVDGGGLYSYLGVGLTLTNCVLQNNSAASGGGGMYSDTGRPLLTNCTLQSNLATTGGAIGITGTNYSLTLTNSIVWNNGGGNSFSVASGSLVASYSLFEPSSITYAGLTSGPGNLTTTVSPFVSPTPTTPADVALNACTPAINTGNNSATGLTGITTDLVGNGRFYNSGQVDMGAVEFQGNSGLPTSYSVLGSGTATCASSPTITLSGSETGVSYQLRRDGTNVGSTVAGTGSALSFGTQPVSGTYTVLATNTVSSCTLVMAQSATVVSNTVLPNATLSASPNGTLTCAQTSLTLTAGGGVSYTFSGPGLSQSGSSATAVVNQAGTYSVVVTNANGCTATSTTVISQSAGAPTAGLVSSGTLTCSVTALTLTASGGSSYAFSGPVGGPTGVVTSSGNSATVNVGGVYSVTVTNTATGCSSVTTTTVSSNISPPSILLPSTSTATAGVLIPGGLVFTASGGNGTYTFALPALPPGLSVGLSTATQRRIDGVPTQSGVYPISLTVTDGAGCSTVSAPYNLSVNCPTLTLTTPTISTATVGVTIPNTISWSVSGSSGIHTFNFSTLPTALSVTASSDMFRALGGGISHAGTYPISLTVTDPYGCSVVAPPYNLTATCRSLSLTTPGVSTALVGVALPTPLAWQVSRGASPYSFSFSSFPSSLTTNSVFTDYYDIRGTPTQPGTFPISLTVTDANGCSLVSNTYSLTTSCATLALSTTTNIASCGGTGSIAFTTTLPNGTYSLSYVGAGSPRLVSVSSGGFLLTGLSAGSYGSFSINYGSSACILTVGSTVVLTNPASPTVSITPASGTLTCSQTSLTLTASTSGTGVVWSTGATTNSIVVTTANTYTVTATDANGCTSSTTATVSSNTTAPTLTVTPDSGTLTCALTSLTLAATSGLTNYSFNTGQNGASNTLLVSTAGTYSVVATGANGCTNVASATVVSSSAVISASLVASGAISCSSTSVTLTASPSNLTYTFGSGALQIGTTNRARVSSAGTYSVTVTDAGGCSAVAQVTVTGSTSALTSAILTPNLNGTLTCASRSLTLTASATGNGLSYVFGPSVVAQSGSLATVNAAGTYSVTITGANGCTASASTTVFSNTSVIPASLTASGAISCTRTSVTLTAAPGGLSYAFSTGATQIGMTNQAMVSLAGLYSVTVTGAGGCSAVAPVTVTGSSTVAPLSVSASSPVIGCGQASVVITASTPGATSFTLTGAGEIQINTTGVFSVSAVGTYSVSASTAGGCVSVGSQVIGVGIVASASGLVYTVTNPGSGGSGCVGKLTGSGTGTAFVITGPGGYVYSTVYRTAGTYSVTAPDVKQAGLYTLTVSGGGCPSATVSLNVADLCR
jgi:hypothetical protein